MLLDPFGLDHGTILIYAGPGTTVHVCMHVASAM
jgi:hypothetical protein